MKLPWWEILALLLGWLLAQELVHAEVRRGTASWYSAASCQREGTSGIMANGRRLDDEAYTAASWDYPFGTNLRVCAPVYRTCADVEVTDRGPARGLYRRGRVLDLSRAAFLRLAPLSRGVIEVTVEAQIPDGA